MKENARKLLVSTSEPPRLGEGGGGGGGELSKITICEDMIHHRSYEAVF